MKDLFGNDLTDEYAGFLWPSKADYTDRCERRWGGPALRDARSNFSDWNNMRADLLGCMRQFKHNPMMVGNGRHYNPEGSLSSLLWKMQEAWTPDKSCLLPLLDFEERFQRVFLRRGLFIYCEMLLEKLNKTEP